MLPAILLCGKKQAGKDTVAEIIERLMPAMYPDRLKRTVSIAQSDPMKDFCRRALNMSVAQLWGNEKEVEFILPQMNGDEASAWVAELFGGTAGTRFQTAFDSLRHWWRAIPERTTPRHILQTLGTQWGRALDENLWANHAWRRVHKLLATGERGTYLGAPPTLRANLAIVTDGRFPNEVLAAQRNNARIIKILRPNNSTDRHASETGLDDVPSFWFHEVIYNTGSLADLEVSVRHVLVELGLWR